MQNHTAKLSLNCLAAAILLSGLSACNSSDLSNTTTNIPSTDTSTPSVSLPVQSAYFLEEGLLEPISTVSCSLSDGSTGDCYKIVTKNVPTDVGMGPWCPSNIADDASKGGIWLDNGEVHDVDGKFIQNLAQFYGDSNWNMYNKSTGEIMKTSTFEECVAAANPNVGAEYRNYCVECLPEYVADLSETFYIPVTPKPAAQIVKFGGPGPRATGPSVRGIALNGVRFDAPAPVNNILEAYTVAPFDDAGGHVNPHAGYHYHAATGLTTKIAQDDGHAPMIGYALDGYGIYANTGADGTEYTDLDAARGHEDSVRGYHYHVDKAGNNNFIDGLRGVYAEE